MAAHLGFQWVLRPPADGTRIVIWPALSVYWIYCTQRILDILYSAYIGYISLIAYWKEYILRFLTIKKNLSKASFMYFPGGGEFWDVLAIALFSLKKSVHIIIRGESLSVVHPCPSVS